MPDNAATFPLFDVDLPATREDDDTQRLPRLGTAAERTSPRRGLASPPSPPGTGALVRQAWPLIAILARLARGARAYKLDEFKLAVAEQIRAFEQGALAAGLDPRQVAAARYALCTAIDEAISTSDWADVGDWERNSLLSMFHGETRGGEKVFQLIDRALAQPRLYGDLLELFHFVMVLGFQGKFRRQRDGTAAADAVRDRIFTALQQRFGRRASLAAPAAQGTVHRVRLIHYLPVWAVGMVCVFIALLIFAALDYRLRTRAYGVAQRLDQIVATPVTGARP